MNSQLNLGAFSLTPILLAMVLAFVTKDAVLSLMIGCLVGVVLTGVDPVTGMANLFAQALGNRDFVWVLMVEVSVGILIAFYLRAGVIAAFTEWASRRIKTRRAASGFGWLMGLFVFYSDYFSPLFAGPVVRPLTDKHKVSREMLAYTLDSGSAPVCTLIPFTGWAVFIAGILKGYGPIATIEDGMAVFARAIPYNFYGWLALILSGLIAYQIIPNFGPMRRAERRAEHEGKVLRDGATPLTGRELDQVESLPGRKANIFIYLIIPTLIIISIAMGTFIILKSTKVLEAFMAAVIYLATALTLGRHFRSVKDGMDVAMSGIKGVLPAILILAMAYCINAVSKNLGAQQYVISITEAWMTSWMLPLVAFGTAGFISFFTGTSWGAYAIVIPIVMPIAFSISGGEMASIVLLSVGAVVGGGLFGDHCSPVSDTTCLSSFGAGSDHIDHVTTQLPYALTAAILAGVAFIVFGLMATA
jgi:Na+/H+ antiporter NhaC